jgi:hypothetical protein
MIPASGAVLRGTVGYLAEINRSQRWGILRYWWMTGGVAIALAPGDTFANPLMGPFGCRARPYLPLNPLPKPTSPRGVGLHDDG